MLSGTSLLFRSVDDAPDVIARILAAPERWSSLSDELMRRGQQYSGQAFSRDLIALVRSLFDRPPLTR
jgi:hypothetical protein